MIKRFRFTDRPAYDAATEPAPFRVAVCTTMPELSPSPRHGGVVIEWFAEPPAGDDGDAVVVAEEVVLRGADWLDERWRDGGVRWKHMALALRAPDLTQAELSERWRSHAGRAGNRTIPDLARGRAYVQDHPVGSWAYDAVNEVWFDDLDSLRVRVEWFAEQPVGDELFRASWFLAVREEVVWPVR